MTITMSSMFLSGSPNPYTFPNQSLKRVAPAPPIVLASVSLNSWFTNKQPDKFFSSEYSQTCVQQPPLGPEKSGR